MIAIGVLFVRLLYNCFRPRGREIELLVETYLSVATSGLSDGQGFMPDSAQNPKPKERTMSDRSKIAAASKNIVLVPLNKLKKSLKNVRQVPHGRPTSKLCRPASPP
jgi:hypothetical protein